MGWAVVECDGAGRGQVGRDEMRWDEIWDGDEIDMIWEGGVRVRDHTMGGHS